MRVFCLSLLLAGIAAPAYAQQAPDFEPYSAYVAPQGGLRVREAPQPDAPVLITLWQGAKVFVRERSASYARIDGYGVAGYAYVDERFLTSATSSLAEPGSHDEAQSTPSPAT
jgi:hypothetical protein